MEQRLQARLKMYVELPDGSTVETADGLRKYISEHPVEPIYVKRRGKRVLVGWQLWLPGTFIAP